MLRKILSATICICFVLGVTSVPLTFKADTFSFENKSVFAKSDKAKSKGKKEKKAKTDKNCSRDVNCNDENENRKDGEKGKKGGKSEEMKAKGKKK